jgi:hypothetical protein|tara:strand:- start:239 stop:883 length:645 start_codon:yes stop_codon:yes gene_type:complete
MHKNLYFKIPELRLPDEFFSNTEVVGDPASSQILDFMNTSEQGQRTRLLQTSDKESDWVTGTIDEYVAKQLVEWCNEKFTIRFTNAYIIKTDPGKNGDWHCEGPLLQNRLCALNFLIQGDLGTTKAEWGTHKNYDVDPDFIDRYISKGVKHEDVDVVKEYVSEDNIPFFYNTACLHRSVNENCTSPRTVLSVSAPFNIGMKEITKMYENGTLFR